MYCIDASSIIHAWRRDYPQDTFPTLWDNIEALVVDGRLISPSEVLLELGRGGDEIYEWAEGQDGLFREPDDEVQGHVGLIVDRWPAFVPDESHDGVWADPYIIALAIVHEAVVITGERKVGANARRPKIPNICEALGVPCGNLLNLLRTEGWTF